MLWRLMVGRVHATGEQKRLLCLQYICYVFECMMPSMCFGFQQENQFVKC